MRLNIWLVATATLFSLNTWADDTQPTPAAPSPRAPAQYGGENIDTTPVDTGSSDTGYVRHKDSGVRGFSVMADGYYDFSNYSKLQTTTVPQNSTSSSGNGAPGMLVMIAYTTPQHIELGMGFDYMFPVGLQGQQNFTSTVALNNQNLNVLGVRVAQIGYNMSFGQFSLVPYGAVGLYYGRSVANITTNANLVDTVTFSKLMATFTAGARAEFNFTPNFSLHAALEGTMPANLDTSLAQSGQVGSYTAGYESNLQSNMDFWTSFGFRLMLGAKATF